MATQLARSRSKRVRLADVAAAAGVSVATASVAITGRRSGNCRVSPAVAEKIRRTAAQLKYRPNLQARNLSTQRTRTIALLIKRPAWHNAMLYVSSAQRVLSEAGYTEVVMLQPDHTVESERAHIDLCIERQVEGVIAIPLIDLEGRANVDAFNKLYQEEGIPVVQLGLALEGCVAPSIMTDEVGGIAQAVRLLHAMGHRQIAYATNNGYDNPAPLNPYRIAHLRYLGYLQAVRELGLNERVLVASERCLSVDMMYDQSVKLGRQVASSKTNRPTAIIAFSDFTAAGLIAGLGDAGLAVPQQVSILAIGDQPFGRMLRPALTTLSPQFERMGELATQTLLTMIDGGEGASAAVLPSLVMRDSIAELRAS